MKFRFIFVLIIFLLIFFFSCNQKALNQANEELKINPELLEQLNNSLDKLSMLREEIELNQSSNITIPLYLKNELNETINVTFNTLNINEIGEWINGSGASCYASDNDLSFDKIKRSIFILIKPNNILIPPSVGKPFIMEIKSKNISDTFYCVVIISYNNRVYSSKDFIIEVK